MTTVRTWIAVGAAIASSPTGALATTRPDASAAVARVIERFDAARASFDPQELAAVLAPDYEEISPIGEVDTRDKVLGFYAPDKRVPAPPMSSSEQTVRVFGDTALATVRRSMTLPAANGGASITRAIRVRYVARRMAGGWQLVSAQYTPIPAPR